jgi:hypothetical protein
MEKRIKRKKNKEIKNILKAYQNNDENITGTIRM